MITTETFIPNPATNHNANRGIKRLHFFPGNFNHFGTPLFFPSFPP
jgi:hypothetical protein